MAELSDLPSVVREALCAWQLFRQLGYGAEQIYVGAEEGKMLIQARWRGMDFTYCAGETELTAEEFESVWWPAAADAMQATSDDELCKMWDTSKVMTVAPAILIGMANKGIYWPSHEKFRKIN